MHDQITRNFTAKRGEQKIIYPFTTFSFIFEEVTNPILKKVYSYLKDIFLNGHPDFSGKISASEAKPVLLPIEEKKSDLVDFAMAADYRGRNSGQHLCVQRHLLENDPNTLAIEIPVWDDKHSGHIDILRLFPDCIELADFKPKAGKESKASTQLFRYRSMAAERIGLPLGFIRCVYFDDRYSYFLT